MCTSDSSGECGVDQCVQDTSGTCGTDVCRVDRGDACATRDVCGVDLAGNIVPGKEVGPAKAPGESVAKALHELYRGIMQA